MTTKQYDYIILGAGIYGLYIAHKLAFKYPAKTICVLEYDAKPFQRASYINQARVHNGYHYPRSLSTALKSANYYSRFIKDYEFAINKEFQKIYAISSNFSYVSGTDFKKFCSVANIPCNYIHPSNYFKDGTVDECFLTSEYGLDSQKICNYFISELSQCKNITIKYNARMQQVEQINDVYRIALQEEYISSNFVINTTYASVNQVLELFGLEKFKLKYEIAELCLCKVTDNVKYDGITVMDGAFFSLMPFGFSGYSSLSSVHFTPHSVSYENLPTFKCQQNNNKCTPFALENCNLCDAKPKTAWVYMKQLASKYLKEDINMEYHKSLFAIKPILQSSEISDSRPTIIKEFSSQPTFISVLSGKFNTMYDLDEILKW